MRMYMSAGVAAALLMPLPELAEAASLQVAPVILEIPAPGASATIKLRNEGTTALNAQVRVFRWTQVNGEEKLEPTDAVVASPPIISLAGKSDYVVRVVRLSKQPIASSETYRLLVDELPDPARQRHGTVAIVLRYSIPVFFYSAQAAAPKLAWSTSQRGGQVFVTATNDGDRHVRLADLKLDAGQGRSIAFGSGLAGYVLGHSSMRWTVTNSKHRLGTGNPVAITAQSETGPVGASSIMQAAR
jgi:fimbrial chaperone protein